MDTHFYHHQHSWENTCGFFLSFKAGSLRESKDHEGITHVAEHMMFCGTEKMSLEEFQKKIHYIFSEIRAITSRDRVNIFALFHSDDFDEAVEILEQMIFHWKCTPDAFQEEKKELLEEATDFFDSDEHEKFKSRLDFFPLKQIAPLGSMNFIQTLSASDIPHIKSYWDDFVMTTPRSLSFIGKLSKQQSEKLQNIFLKNMPQREIIGKWNIMDSGFVSEKNIIGFWYKSNTAHLCTIVLDGIFFWRCSKIDTPSWRYDSLITDTIAEFFMYDKKGKFADQEREVFDLHITEEEFLFVQKRIIYLFDENFDVIDAFDSLNWFNDFDVYIYGHANIQSPLQAYQYLRSLTYEDFMKFIRTLN